MEKLQIACGILGMGALLSTTDYSGERRERLESREDNTSSYAIVYEFDERNRIKTDSQRGNPSGSQVSYRLPRVIVLK